MPWAKFDDRYIEHPKIRKAGPRAELLDYRAIIHSCRYGTRGFVSHGMLDDIGRGLTDPLKHAGRLVEVGRWETCEGGWQIHDFAVYQSGGFATQLDPPRPRFPESTLVLGEKTPPPWRAAGLSRSEWLEREGA
jgi:hypothetical protein